VGASAGGRDSLVPLLLCEAILAGEAGGRGAAGGGGGGGSGKGGEDESGAEGNGAGAGAGASGDAEAEAARVLRRFAAASAPGWPAASALLSPAALLAINYAQVRGLQL
jgi:hypothetical protein